MESKPAHMERGGVPRVQTIGRQMRAAVPYHSNNEPFSINLLLARASCRALIPENHGLFFLLLLIMYVCDLTMVYTLGWSFIDECDCANLIPSLDRSH